MRKRRICKATDGSDGLFNDPYFVEDFLKQAYAGIHSYAGGGMIDNWKEYDINQRATAITGAAAAAGNLILQGTDGQPVNAAKLLSGATQGAAIGTSIAPGIGTGIGAGLGLAVSSIGNKGSVDATTGEITYGSGIAGMFGPSKHLLLRRSNAIKNNNFSRQATQQLRVDAANDPNLEYNPVNAAVGGVIPSTAAYLDDGELIRTPDGTIGAIPEEGKPTDSNLLNVPVGTQVLSDKLKVPGTNKTFAEMGKKLMKPTKGGNDKYAENSRMLNERNNQQAYQDLLNLQESIKIKKGKKKDDVPAYDGGTDGANTERSSYFRDPTTGFYYRDKGSEDHYYVEPQWIAMPDGSIGYRIPDRPGNYVTYSQSESNTSLPKRISVPANSGLSYSYRNSVRYANYEGDELYKTTEEKELAEAATRDARGAATPNTNWGDVAVWPTHDWGTGYELPQMPEGAGKLYFGGNQSNSNKSGVATPNYRYLSQMLSQPMTYIGPGVYRPVDIKSTPTQVTTTQKPVGTQQILWNTQQGFTTQQTNAQPTPNTQAGVAAPGGVKTSASYRSKSVSKPAVKPTAEEPKGKEVYPREAPVYSRNLTQPIPEAAKTLPQIPKQEPENETKTRNTFDWTGLVQPLASTAYNLLNREKPDRVETRTYSPAYGPATQDISDELRQVNLNSAIAAYNASKRGANTGAYMSQLALNAVNRNNAVASLYETKRNKEAEMAFQNAGIYNRWGEYTANAQHTADVEYAQNKAETKNMNRQSAQAILEDWQNYYKDVKQDRKDAALYQLLQPLLNYGTEDQAKAGFDAIYSGKKTVVKKNTKPATIKTKSVKTKSSKAVKKPNVTQPLAPAKPTYNRGLKQDAVKSSNIPSNDYFGDLLNAALNLTKR